MGRLNPGPASSRFFPPFQLWRCVDAKNAGVESRLFCSDNKDSATVGQCGGSAKWSCEFFGLMDQMDLGFVFFLSQFDLNRQFCAFSHATETWPIAQYCASVCMYPLPTVHPAVTDLHSAYKSFMRFCTWRKRRIFLHTRCTIITVAPASPHL